LISGYAGGRIDALIMRVADVQLSFPAILIALLIDGVARAVVPGDMHEVIAFPVLVGAIALAGWPQYARTVRGSTLVEKNREYVQAARVIGISSPVIMFRHVLAECVGARACFGDGSLGYGDYHRGDALFLRGGCAADFALLRHAHPDWK
jgi:peptide/nickel transport system permease protein